MRRNSFLGQWKIKLNFGIKAMFLWNLVLTPNLRKCKGESLFSLAEPI